MKRWLVPALLISLTVGFRLLGSYGSPQWANFQPLAALFFCSAVFAAPGWKSFALPVVVWFATYFAPAWFNAPGSEDVWSAGILVTTLGAFGVTYAIGAAFHRRPVLALIGALAAALSFHLLTCGTAWLADPRYAKSLTGLWQSLWTGLPGDPFPSWLFLRNLLAANLLFTGVVQAALRSRRATAPAEPTALAR
jgi:hypothetical protein